MSNKNRLFGLNPLSTPKDAALLNVNELRDLVKWCNNQNESLWLRPYGPPLTVTQILALWHATAAADYFSFDDWRTDDVEAALAAWNRIVSEGVAS